MPVPAAPYDAALLEDNQRVTVRHYYTSLVGDDIKYGTGAAGYLKTPKPSKNLTEVPELIKEVIEHRHSRQAKGDTTLPIFTYDQPTDKKYEEDIQKGKEFIVYSVSMSLPGGRGRGSPFDQPTKELTPRFREQIDDDENPGYKKAAFGQWFDSVIQLSCWAPTSRRAEELAGWVISTIKEYNWWLAMQGINRFLFWGRQKDKVEEVKGNKFYVKPLEFFVRTEDITIISEKKMEDILISISIEQY